MKRKNRARCSKILNDFPTTSGTLSRVLKALEEKDLIKRVVDPNSRPPTSYYSATEDGKKLVDGDLRESFTALVKLDLKSLGVFGSTTRIGIHKIRRRREKGRTTHAFTGKLEPVEIVDFSPHFLKKRCQISWIGMGLGGPAISNAQSKKSIKESTASIRSFSPSESC